MCLPGEGLALPAAVCGPVARSTPLERRLGRPALQAPVAQAVPEAPLRDHSVRLAPQQHLPRLERAVGHHATPPPLPCLEAEPAGCQHLLCVFCYHWKKFKKKINNKTLCVFLIKFG